MIALILLCILPLFFCGNVEDDYVHHVAFPINEELRIGSSNISLHYTVDGDEIHFALQADTLGMF